MNVIMQAASKDAITTALIGLGFLGLWRWGMGHNFDLLLSKPSKG